MARPLNLLAIAGALALGAPIMAAAQNKPLNGLGLRGAITGTDQLPVLPSGAASLQAAYASDLKKYALTSVDTFGADPTGAADSTAAIQAAINSGQSLSCNGVYKVSSTLTMSTTASHGQLILGSGSTSAGANVTGGRCVIRPAAGMAGAVFKIDGAPFNGWLEGFGFENLTVDLVNMSDVSGNAAFNQVQAYDGHYENVRVVNDGSNKRAWLFSTGAYTTTLKDTQGNWLDFEGTSTSSGVTTISVLNHDGSNVLANYADNLNFIGGAFQGTGGIRFTLNYTAATRIQTDVEGTGTYLSVNNTDNGLWSQSELQGFTGTYMSGTAAPAQMLLDQQINYNTYPFNIDYGHFNLNNAGVASYSSLLSGAAGADYYLEVGRTGLDALLGVAATTNDFLSGTAAGDTILSSWGSGEALWLGGFQTPIAKVTSTGFTTFGAGTLSEGIINVKPTSDSDVFTVQNHAGNFLFDINTLASPGPLVELLNNATLIGYSGNFTGQTWKITTSIGLAQFQAQTIQPASDGATLVINNSGASGVFGVTTNSTASLSTVNVNTGVFEVNSKPLISATAPSYSSGFSSGAPSIVGATTAAFTVALGATPGATGTLTMPAASTGWICTGIDRTTAAGTIRESATTATSVTFALNSTAASDVLQFQCTGY